MQFIDLKKQYHFLKNDIDNGIHRVLDSGSFILGPEITELEQNLADFAGVRHALTCASGTDALLMPLMAWDIGPGDAVFTTAFSFFATAEVIANVGATPVFVDISDTFNIDPEKLDKAIEKTLADGKLKPKVIIPVDLFGLPADYVEIESIALKYGLKVLEDAAQGFGGHYRGKRAGSFGDAAATSFFPAKPLGCYGDGGAVFTNDDELAQILKSIRVHGQGKDKYENVRLGINGRFDTLQAVVLLPKLAVFDQEIEKRNDIAKRYSQALLGLVATPPAFSHIISTWAQYSVLAKSSGQRTQIIEDLAAKNIPVMIYYSIPLHLQKAFAYCGYKKGDFPISEDFSARIFSLPMHAYLSDEDVNTITAALISAIHDNGGY